MDDHDYDGVSRSSDFDQPIGPGDYTLEAFVPASAKSDSSAYGAKEKLRFQPKLVSVRQAAEPARHAKRNFKKPLPQIVGSSPQSRQVRELISLYADDDAPVMITGETGVGKELVARHLHALSARSDGAFSPINAGGMPESLAAAELFGHAKGAYTGAVGERDGAIAMADNGVLFLDEIGDMPLSIQAHLLRVLEDGMVMKLGGKSPTQVDFRLISATNVDLRDNVRNGKFRSDLFYRIHVLLIHVPPLRERGDDVIEIAEAMIAAHPKEKYRKTKLTPKAADRLKSFSFPGNVRELRNILSGALVHARDGKILPEHLFTDPDAIETCRHFSESYDVDEAKSLASRFVMMKALQASGGNVSKAAALIGRSRGTLHTMMKDLEGEDFASAYEAVRAEMSALLNEQ